MKKFFMSIVAAVVFTTVLFFSTSLNANAASPKIIIGEATLVGERMLMVKEDITQMEYEFNVSPGKLKDVSTGYRVEVRATDGKVSSLTILGMPMGAEPEPFQKWRVIKYPER